MARGLFRWAGILAAVLLLHAPAGAENPRVTLRLEQVTCDEAARALTRATGIPVLVYTDPFVEFEGRPPEPAREPRASFVWEDAPFSQALRQLCDRFRLTPGRGSAGAYLLHPTFEPPPVRPARRVGLVERRGMRLFVRGVQYMLNRGLAFEGEGENVDHSQLTLQLGGEVPGGTADAIAGIVNISAADDLGNLLVADPQEAGPNVYAPMYPDEFIGHVGFTGPHPRATRLAWLQGDVIGYRLYRAHRAEVSLDEPGARYRLGGIALEVVAYGPPGSVPDAPREAPVPDPAHAEDHEALPLGSVLRFRAAPGPDGFFPDPWMLAPVLMDGEGRLFPPIHVDPKPAPEGVASVELECGYGTPVARGARALFVAVERSQPEKLFSFRMTDIPLPPERRFVPHRMPVPPDAPTGSLLPPRRPYLQQGGGLLVLPVELDGRPAPGGTLTVGLSLQTGDTWSGIYWVELEVDADGLARLEHVKPGRYRLRRVFSAEPPLPEGSWSEERVEVEIEAGRELRAPPLRWSDTGEPAEHGGR